MSFLCDDCIVVLGNQNDFQLKEIIFLETVNIDLFDRVVPNSRLKFTKDSIMSLESFKLNVTNGVLYVNSGITSKIKYLIEKKYFIKCKKCNKSKSFVDKVSGVSDFHPFSSKRREAIKSFSSNKDNSKEYSSPLLLMNSHARIFRQYFYNCIIDEKIISTKSDGAIFYFDLIKKTKSKLEKERINKLVDDYLYKYEKKESKNNALKLRSIDKMNRNQRKSMSFWSKYNYLIVAFFLIIIFSSVLLIPFFTKMY
jgi:hypothetical protein